MVKKKLSKKLIDAHFNNARQIPKFYNWFQGSILTWSLITQVLFSLTWFVCMWIFVRWYLFLGWVLHFWFVVRPIYKVWKMMGGFPKYKLMEGVKELHKVNDKK